MKLLQIFLIISVTLCITQLTTSKKMMLMATSVAPASTVSSTYTGKAGGVTTAPACSTIPASAFLLLGNWPAVTRTILTVLPEGTKCPTTYLASSGQWDPNFRFSNLANLGGEATATLTVTFLYVNAGYKNQLGYFTFDSNNKILTKTILFQCIQMGTTAPGCLTIGDSVKIGPFTATSNVGFYIRSNGWNDSSSSVPQYYSLTSLNSDGKDHVAMFQDSTTGNLLMGFEDQSLGDADYNDVIFMVTADPSLASLPTVPLTTTCKQAGCSNKGSCDLTSGRCTCTTGTASSFTGALCTDTVTCSTPCVNGICVDTDLCQCSSGFDGDVCDLAVLVDTALGLSSSCGKRKSNLYYLANQLTGSLSVSSDLDNLYINVAAATGFTIANVRIQAGTGSIPKTGLGLLDIASFGIISTNQASANFSTTVGLTSIGATCGSKLNLAVQVDIKGRSGKTLASWAFGENLVSLTQFWFSYQVCCDGLIPQPQPVIPMVKCASANEDGSWTAHFSYNNQNSAPVNINIGTTTNAVSPGQVNQGQPFVFLAGIIEDAFYVVLDDCKATITWSLTGPDAITRSVTATSNSTICTRPAASPPPTFPTPKLPISPILWCTSKNDDDSYTSRWGYKSDNDQTVFLAIDTSTNFFTGNCSKKAQTILFLPGTMVNDFYITWDGTPITWTIAGPDGSVRTATADTVTKLCGQDLLLNASTLVTTLPKPPCAPIAISGCGVINEDKTITARFSYVSTNTFVAGIAVGASNKVTAADGSNVKITGQPVLFAPGTVTDAFFAVASSSTSITWTVLTPYATAAASVTVSANTPACPDITPAPTAVTGTITPIVNCVVQNDDGSWTARFGYKTDVNAELFAVKASSDNYITPAAAPQSQNLYFRQGTRNNTFFVNFNKLPITWSVRGPDGKLNSATADQNADSCTVTTKYLLNIVPILNCIIKNEDKTYTARFGYNNLNPNGLVRIPQGSSNVLSFGDGRQPTVYGPGLHNLVFYVVYNTTNLPSTWTLTSPNGFSATLTVTVNGPNNCESSI